MFEHLCATLLQQSHLCPVPLEAQPVFWNFDHALHLYPIPDVLVLADRAPCASFAFPPMPADQLDQSCVCLNPVSALLLSSDTGRPLPNNVPDRKRFMWCYWNSSGASSGPHSYQQPKPGEWCVCHHTCSALHWWPSVRASRRGALAWQFGRALGQLQSLESTAILLRGATPCRGPS